jgi:DNA-binding Lrp family transcriptional regulator
LITDNSMSSNEIAEKLNLNPRTVKNYLYRLKEGVSTDPSVELRRRKEEGKWGVIYYKICKKTDRRRKR